MAKAKPEKVNARLARTAIQRAKSRGAAWSEYIRAHYQATGSLAPGCDAKDFVAYAESISWGQGETSDAR